MPILMKHFTNPLKNIVRVALQFVKELNKYYIMKNNNHSPKIKAKITNSYCNNIKWDFK